LGLVGFLEGEFLVSDVDIAVDVPSLLDVIVARANEFLAGEDVSFMSLVACFMVSAPRIPLFMI